MGGSAYVGLSPVSTPFSGTKGSFAYHGSTGHKSCDGEDWQCYGPNFAYNDVVGCGIIDDTVFFTKNGEFLGAAFRGVPRELYPTVGFWEMGHTVEANFGQESFMLEPDWDKLRGLCGE